MVSTSRSIGSRRRRSRIEFSSTTPQTASPIISRPSVLAASSQPVARDDSGHERREGDEYRVDEQDLGEERARTHLHPFIGTRP